jgi:energy-coupling factor transporter ATP-binding protein EcfA2
MNRPETSIRRATPVAFRQLNKSGTSVVIATHDIALMDEYDARRLVLHDGRLHTYDENSVGLARGRRSIAPWRQQFFSRGSNRTRTDRGPRAGGGHRDHDLLPA